MDISKLQAEGDMAENGVWVEMDGARFKIRSSDSKIYRKIAGKLGKKRSGSVLRKSTEAQLELSIEIMADAVLIDFEGVEENGKPLANTLENRLKLCRLEPIRNFIATECQDLENFQKEAVAADAEDLKSDG